MTVKKRFIGKTNVEVSELGFGTAPLGGWPVEVSDKNAQSSLQKAWDLGIRYFDTAPLYGSGMSEIRLGNFLKIKTVMNLQYLQKLEDLL
jgi:D-threo-aldose 1-dehydrogenase